MIVNDESYRNIITHYLVPKLGDALEEMCFQQDGAICYITLKTLTTSHELSHVLVTRMRHQVLAI